LFALIGFRTHFIPHNGTTGLCVILDRATGLCAWTAPLASGGLSPYVAISRFIIAS
jgi:hypothetical protein